MRLGLHPWGRYTLRQIWAMLEPQSRTSGQIAVDMWARIRKLCEEEADQIEKALARLEQRWPRTQAAADVFQEWGAGLVAAMRGTAAAAARNGPIVDTITARIAAARDTVAGLLDDAAEFERIEALQGLEMADRVYAGRYGVQLPARSGPWDLWRQGLDQHAQQTMRELEVAIYVQHLMLKEDEPYEPPLYSNVRVPPDLAVASPRPKPPPRRSEVSVDNADVWPGVAPFPSGNNVVQTTALASVSNVSSTSESDRPTSPRKPIADSPFRRVPAPEGVPGGPGSGAGSINANGVAARPPAVGGMVPLVPPTMAPPSTAAGSRGASRRPRRGLPGVFWAPPGPPAIIQPPEEPRHHDPGPGVIGIDQ